ncbi:hypothetical protein JMK10_02945 [Rhodovulum sulfidophilum]|uniref:hypothetical protein n=2 Tax=Rhodovulum sulfidophilum TaxID=35806 RepID=UPI001924DA5D|nr:hypothetical protein [Rhodovulum sulfidophilum]MBL3576243.1 hypothetical protein [Rhodovulum sulfidophilum]MCF4115791.1 hypothetical protein [Rhodovulum sulfidophilum]
MRKWLLKRLMHFISWRSQREIQKLHDPNRGNPHNGSFIVRRSLKSDFGRQVARMHWSNRPFANRYDIVRISHKDNHIFVPVLGLGEDESGHIARLGYDLRRKLNLPKDATVKEERFNLTIEKAGFWGQLYWYLSANDPAVKVPAWLAFWSVMLGLAGFLLAILSLCI